MGSFKHPRAFQPLDLEIIDRVYEAAWAALEASDPFRDRAQDGERGETLRKLVMDSTEPGRVDFDILCGRVLANMPENGLCSFGRSRTRRPVEDKPPGAGCSIPRGELRGAAVLSASPEPVKSNK